MKQSNTSERLKEIMNKRKLRQVDILKKARPYCEKYGIRLEKNDLSQYVSGKVNPGQEKLTILGLALDVTEAWLSGYDVPMAREDTLSQSESATKKKEPNEADLLETIKDIYGSASALMFEMYLKLDEIDRAKVLERLETLLEADKYSTQDAYLNGKII